MSHWKWRSEDGFTLVELLASLTVFAMLSLMLLAGVGERGIAWTRMDRETSRGETVEAVQALLYRWGEHIWPATVYNLFQPSPDFDGEADHMVFLAPPPPTQAPGPLRRYQLSLDTRGDLVLDSVSDVALVRRQWTDRPARRI